MPALSWGQRETTLYGGNGGGNLLFLVVLGVVGFLTAKYVAR